MTLFPPEKTGWRRMPVFIASTFRDMDYERDVITRIIIPAVNARLQAQGRGVSLYPIDLRWGIETDARFDPAVRQRIILETCVAEVRRCRPLFLGIIGTKYGWIPPPEISGHVLREAELSDIGFPLSVTAIEMLTAVRACAHDRVAPVLLARQVPAVDRAHAVAAGMQDDPPGSSGAACLAELGRYLRTAGHPWLTYESRWRVDRNRLESKGFVELTTDALLTALDDALFTDAPDDWLTAELTAQHWAAEREVQQFVGRAAELKFIAEFWGRDRMSDVRDIGDEIGALWELRRQFGESMVAVLGESGSGKTALLAKIAFEVDVQTIVSGWLGADETDFSMQRTYVSVGVTPASRRLPVCVLLLLAQLDADAAHTIAARHGPTDLELDDILDIWLTTLRARDPHGMLLVVADGLDRFHGGLSESLSVAWLPIDLGERAHFLVSATDTSFEGRLMRLRPSTEILELGPFAPHDARDLVVTRVTAYHKALPDDVLEQVATRSTYPRWLVVATDLLLTLMRHDYLVVQRIQSTGTDPEEAIRRVLSMVAAGLPDDMEALHVEVLERLYEFTELWFGGLIAALSTVSFGLREDDLHQLLGAMTESMRHRSGAAESGSDLIRYVPADLALARDMLSAFLTVTGDEWSFAHPTVRRGAALIVENASEELGFDVRAGYQRMLVGYLSSLPIEDSVRSRELLPLLVELDETAILLEAMADPALSSDTALRLLASVFIVDVQLGRPSGYFGHLIESARTDAELLAVIPIVVGAVLPHLAAADAKPLVELCRQRLAAVSPGVTGRHGLDVTAVRELIESTSADPLHDTDSSAAASMNWLRTTMAAGGLTLREALTRTATFTEPRLRIAATTSTITTCALAIAAGAAMDPAGPGIARSALAQCISAIGNLDDPNNFVREYFHLSIVVAERAAALAWPEAGFRADESDLHRLRALNEHNRGVADYVVLYARCAHLHGVECWLGFDPDDDLPDDRAAMADSGLRILEDALWALDVQQDLTPDALHVQVMSIQCRTIHLMLAEMFDQHATACRSGIVACSQTNSPEILGWAEFADVAWLSLSLWIQWPIEIDATTVIERLAVFMDNRHRDPNGFDAAEVRRFEAMILAAGIKAAHSFHHHDLGTRLLERAFALQASGRLTDSEEVCFDDLVRTSLWELEDAICDMVTEMAEDIDLEDIPEVFGQILETLASDESEAAEFDSLLASIAWVEGVRRALMRRESASQNDVAGAALCAVFLARVRGDAHRLDEARQLRRLLDPRVLDEHTARLRTAFDLLA